MSLSLPAMQEWARRCCADGELCMAARGWSGTLRLEIGETVFALHAQDGAPAPGAAEAGAGDITFSGSETAWEQVVAAVPSRFNNDLMANISQGLGLSRAGDPVILAQYYPVAMRAVELLRPSAPQQPPVVEHRAGELDAPVGRYIHLELGGHDHRIYFEEAGQGTALLLQHTAGCHGSQWRHLFEIPEITDHFRLIAYDLPHHGKSVPPTSKRWWAEPYRLEGALLRELPLKLAAGLALDRPVFMGCSVGGLLALDLAHRHPEVFRAVIAVEGALNIEGSTENLKELWHPQIGNQYKARLMEGLMSPTSPEAYRKETAFVYASGWPPAFLGDLHYYIDEYDLRQHAHGIDTRRVGVHILSGEYDYSGRAELGRQAHERIAGSTFTEMKGVGHFPMSENPGAFIEYLLPVLEHIRS